MVIFPGRMDGKSTKAALVWFLLQVELLAVQVWGGELPQFTQFYFAEQPRDVIVVSGYPVMLNCSAHHDGATPRIQWKKDGAYLQNNNRIQILTNGSLYIRDVRNPSRFTSDNGEYQCEASVDSLGTIVSTRARVNVSYIKKSFISRPEHLSVHLDDIAMYKCELDSLPAPTVSWYRGNEQLTNNEHINITSDGFLEITLTKESHFGNIKCAVRVMDEILESSFARLLRNTSTDIVSQPFFVMRPQNTKGKEGSTVYLHCGANGRDRQNNRPTITWLKDGITILTDTGKRLNRLSIVGSGTLCISDLQESDAGTYTCRADNMEDSVDADASLSVLVSPRFLTRPKNIFAHTTNDARFDCTIYGNPPPHIEWLKDGDVIQESDYFHITNGNLEILGLLSNDDGMYQCFGANELGNVQTSAQLVILQADVPIPTTPSLTTPTVHSGMPKIADINRPTAPTNLIAPIVATRFITLSWGMPERLGPSEIIAYSIYWKDKVSERVQVKNTSQYEMNIQHLKPETVYELRVIAYNRYGPGKESADITVKTNPEVHVPNESVNLRAYPLSSTAIKVKWEAPVHTNGHIDYYQLSYYAVGDQVTKKVKVVGTSHILENLRKFKEYSFRVYAHSNNGLGLSTEEVVARTYSDIPSTTPQNYTVETSSSTSLVVRWERPPDNERNGVITGYKIRYKKRGTRKGDSVTTDGNRRLYALTDLQKGSTYQVRIAALTINGSGPVTDWYMATTYRDDLEESKVPGETGKLHVRPFANSIVVTWAPPANSKIMVRGYIIGYGKGISDVYQATLDSKKLYYTIENLQPASQYVITVKAFNNRGTGLPVYETVFTTDATVHEPVTPMLPPIGVKAIVLSASTIVVTWSDNSLGHNQRINDNRYYTVRYAPAMNSNNNRKIKYLNSTDLNAHIDDLRPNSKYEFSVKVFKGRRKSTWSMSVTNTTYEAAPGTVPRDLTPVPVERNPLAVTINWQPPQRPNGQITGYLIFYTTDPSQEDLQWVVEGVVGDKLSLTVKELTPATNYYFKVQARNSKGYGPMSPTVIYRTPKEDGTGGGRILTSSRIPSSKKTHISKEGTEKPTTGQGQTGLSMNVIIIISACVVGAVFIIVIVIVTIYLCKRRNPGDRNARMTDAYKAQNKCKGNNYYKGPQKIIKPPDLWIHHEPMELKNMDKSQDSESSMCNTPVPSQHPDSKSMDGSHNVEMDKRRNSFVGGETSYHSAGEERYTRGDRNIIRPKPVMIPVEAQPSHKESVATVTAMPNGHMVQMVDPQQSQVPMRPVYPRTQYNTQYAGPPRVHAGDVSQPSLNAMLRDDEKSFSDTTFDESTLSRIGYGPQSPESPPPYHQQAPIPYDQLHQHACTPSDGSKSLPGRAGHPLKSFSVPAPPMQSAPNTPTPKHLVKPQQNLSPYKKPTAPISSGPIKPRSPMPAMTTKAPEVAPKRSKEDPDLQKSLSTEELTAEMANLEGLMKDLNAITQQEFEC